MSLKKSELYLKKYAYEMVHIDNFSATKMGLIQAQTSIKIDNLQLICSPFQISMRRAVLLSILSERELPFFNQHKNKLTSLKFAFKRGATNLPPLKLTVWTRINRLIPLKGRQNVCMMDLEYKNCPNDLILILGSYIDLYKTFQNLFIRYKDKKIMIDDSSIQRLKFNNYLEIEINQKKARARLLSLSVNRLLLIIPAIDASIMAGLEFETKLYFQKYRFMIKGKIEQASPASGGFIKVFYVVNFSPELVDIVHDYFKDEALKA